MKRMDLQRHLKHSGALILTLTLVACGQGAAEMSPGLLGLPSALTSTEATSNLFSISGPVEYQESKIIGIRPFIPVRADGSNIEPALRQTLDAFGLITLGNAGSCSGTHLGNGYVLTAGHCFLEHTSSGSLANQACPTIKIHWGYRGSPATGNPKPIFTGSSNCMKLIYAELSPEKDFAILQVDQPPKAAVGIATESDRTRDNTKITIFGYPMGRPLEWSQYCASKKSTSVAVHPFASPSRMAYQCDTQPGNSGSSVIAVNSAGVPKVVAVHDAAAPDPIQYNVGTYMYDIRQTLAKNGFNLDRAVAPQPRKP
jgi:V8-like Glu-specific endopeptidase